MMGRSLEALLGQVHECAAGRHIGCCPQRMLPQIVPGQVIQVMMGLPVWLRGHPSGMMLMTAPKLSIHNFSDEGKYTSTEAA